jgi:glycosyltransferase involved in cell wall biosynthesis
MTKLLIVQPYIPSYRVSFFRRLRSSLADIGVEMRIAAGRPDAAARLRLDDRSESGADFSLNESRFGIGTRTASLRRLGPAVGDWAPERVIIEQAIKNLEAYPLLTRSSIARGPRVAMWGQGRTYSTGQSRAEAAIKQWLTRRSDWLFTYTEGGAEYVINHGFPRNRVTVLKNTLDTDALLADLNAVESEDVVRLQSALGLKPGRTATFLGGVDQHKGIGFLLEAASEIARLLPGFVLLVGGSGAQVSDVLRAQESGYPVRYLGRIEGADKAVVLRASDLLLIPEWIGLVAVDSLVSGVPIVATRHGSHSPEHEYLEDGRTVLYADHEIDAYARAVVTLLCDPDRLGAMSAAGVLEAESLSLQGMVDRFSDGVSEWIHRPGQ